MQRGREKGVSDPMVQRGEREGSLVVSQLPRNFPKVESEEKTNRSL